MINIKKCFYVLLMFFLSNNLIVAQDYFSEVLDSNWNGTGTLMGEEAKFEMRAYQVLNGSFIKLEFKNSRIINGKDIEFKATAYYQVKEDSIVTGYWFDSRGVSFPLNGILKNSGLIINWGTAKTEQGRTEYMFDSDEIIVKDYVLKNSEYFQFANAVYTNE